jgi:hypothetical protein
MTRSRPARLPAALAMLAAVAAGAPAYAARGTVALDTAACPAISEAAIRRIVGIEIGDLLAAPGDATTADANRLAMICEGGAARLEARGAGSDQPVERVLRLADFPGDAAPRALALAGVEMLAALDPAVRERIHIRQSPAAPPAPTPLPPAPPSASASAAHADSSVAPVGIAISAVRRDFLGAGNVGGWGGRVDVDRGLGDLFTLGADVEVAGARTTVTLGEASALLVSAGAFGGLRATGARVAGSLSLGARFGLASLDGTPAGGSGATGGSALRPWWGPALAARGWLRAGAVGFVAMIEGGLAVRGAQGLADGSTILAVDGGWLVAGIGVRF